MTLTISAAEARRLVLALQGLADPPRRKLTAQGLLELVERLGYVQIDSINWVARAHHMILFARNQTYRPELLRRLAEDEAQLFEHWTHDASFIPTRFYPYWQVKFKRVRDAMVERFGRRIDGHFDEQVETVLGRIRDGGAVMARDLAGERTRQAQGWWDWHGGKVALEFLWHTGQLAIARRQGFQKVYDLTERVIPNDPGGEPPDHDGFVDWACRGALERLGVASSGEIARFWDLVSVTEAADWCRREAGRAALPALVESVDGKAPRKVFARPDVADLLRDLPRPSGRLRVLSPFDPILRDRQRLGRLFGFDYRIEIYVPAPKRKYGYYVFPLLEGERLVGRIDMKAGADRQALQVNALWMEPGHPLTKPRLGRLEAELDRVRRFVGAETLRFRDGYLKRDGRQTRRISTR
jgi:uncharacterized protein YcaQ